MFAVAAGFAAGLLHVLSGPDHLAAVAPMAVRRDRVEWRAGLHWGLGHTAGVMLIGLLLIAVRGFLPLDAIAAYSERVVGVALVMVGCWSFYRARRAHRHDHAHEGVPTTVAASFGMGALHGFAGSSHFFGVLPAMALPTQAAALWYLGGFGVAAVIGMSAFAAVVGMITVRASRRGLHAYRGTLYACSVSAFVIGGVWLVM
jgi:hypothetical protein